MLDAHAKAVLAKEIDKLWSWLYNPILRRVKHSLGTNLPGLPGKGSGFPECRTLLLKRWKSYVRTTSKIGHLSPFIWDSGLWCDETRRNTVCLPVPSSLSCCLSLQFSQPRNGCMWGPELSRRNLRMSHVEQGSKHRHKYDSWVTFLPF